MNQTNLFNLPNDYFSKYIGFIYITINKENGKCYIEQKHFKQKGESWETYLGSGKIIKRALNKYGVNSFYKVIVAFGKTNEELNELEKEIIDINNATHNDTFYNIADGGHGGNTFSGYSEEEFKKYCKNLCGKNNPFFGKKHTEKTKKIMLEKRKNRVYKPMSEEQKRLISKTKKELYKNDVIKPNSKKYKIIYKDGTENNFNSQKQLISILKIEKRDIQRIRKHDIPKFKSEYKKQLFENIKVIYENDIVIFEKN